ncbi:MAG: hypothetical protein H6555_10980 [Lewinellaceae bacterium]|nr:hypothetical protein [Lewinellaceae bacterium]
MKRRNHLATSAKVIATLMVFALFTSCNRGYGCPTNFSLPDFLIDAAQVLVRIF